jgi:hypothetical protein
MRNQYALIVVDPCHLDRSRCWIGPGDVFLDVHKHKKVAILSDDDRYAIGKDCDIFASKMRFRLVLKLLGKEVKVHYVGTLRLESIFASNPDRTICSN